MTEERRDSKINQYILKLESDIKILIVKRDDPSKVIYGVLEPGWETHYMMVENRRDQFKKTQYFLTDFDFVLGGNPHTKGMR